MLLICFSGEWGEWGEWGSCSTTCGDGIQTRTRTCPGPHPCDGNASETRSCDPANDICYSKWNQFEFSRLKCYLLLFDSIWIFTLKMLPLIFLLFLNFRVLKFLDKMWIFRDQILKTFCVTFTAVQMRMEIGENGKLVMRNVEENKQGLNFVLLSPAKTQHLQRNKTALLVSESLKKKCILELLKNIFA